MNSNVKAMMAVTFLVLGLFTGTNYMVDREVGTNWLMWTIVLLSGALLFWLWMMREEGSTEETIEESLDAAEETLKRLETKVEAAQAAPVPSAEPEVAAVEEPVAEETEPVAARPSASKSATSSNEPDDLTLIDGIGPKSAAILVDADVDTFAKLAAMSEDEIVDTIRAGGGRKSASMSTWADKAKALAES